MSYFEEQETAWLDGGMEWYAEKNGINPDELEGIPGDFDPYEYQESREGDVT